MKTDSQIQKDVNLALEWCPSITHEKIGVSVSEGIVTLAGSTPSYFEKAEAEQVTQRVGGVKAVVEKIEVKLPSLYARDDQEIAKAILSQFKFSVSVPGTVQVKVENGWVDLTGEVEWEYQRASAKNGIRDLIGVSGVTNDIKIKAKKIQPAQVKERIEEALKSEAKREASRIKVEVNESTVTLTGDVNSVAEKNDAKWAAWNAPGVTKIENNIRVHSF